MNDYKTIFARVVERGNELGWKLQLVEVTPHRHKFDFGPDFKSKSLGEIAESLDLLTDFEKWAKNR